MKSSALPFRSNEKTSRLTLWSTTRTSGPTTKRPASWFTGRATNGLSRQSKPPSVRWMIWKKQGEPADEASSSGTGGEEQVETSGSEQEVRPPRRERRRQHLVTPHLLEETEQPPVRKPNCDSDRDSVQRSPLSDRQREWQPHDHHYETGEGEGDLALQCNSQVDYVEA